MSEEWVIMTAKAIDERLHGGQSGTERTRIIEEMLRRSLASLCFVPEICEQQEWIKARVVETRTSIAYGARRSY